LAGSVRKAGRVALAMDARGFGAFPSKTYRVKITVNRSDWLFVAGVAVVLVALLTGLWFLGVARFAIG
jgi:energy-coupling factor transporter transmembrane protein EcfT